MKKSKNTNAYRSLAAVAGVFAAIVASVLLLFGCADKTTPEKPTEPEKAVFTEQYPTSARQGYYGEILGTVTRRAPYAVTDGGLSCGYPVYGTKLNLTDAEKSDVIAESVSLCARPTTPTGGSYDKMDKDGFLYNSDGTAVKDDSGAQRRLYKHTAAQYMYHGEVSDTEPAVKKRITFKPRPSSVSYNVTGLYAPAGEVITLEMSEADMTATGGVRVYIGQALYNGKNNNIWAARDLVRMPIILNTMLFDPQNSEYDSARKVYTCYVGSYLGGPIYIGNSASKMTVTVSGAVQYRHFILGNTTESEFESLCKSSAPYFDMEIWDCGVLHSGPLTFVKDYDYEKIYDAAVLWEKVGLVSTYMRKTGIVMIYDPFVAAGAAVAFPGQYSTNCPTGWMANALDSAAIVESGAWGVFHEFNHNFQGWGLDGGGEVTNNALTLVSYSAFTEISAARTIDKGGETGLSGWNTYTSATYALSRVLGGYITSTDQLSIYATLLHNIGAENFMRGLSASGATNYYKELCSGTGVDMTHFFTTYAAARPDESAIAEIKAKNYPAFVPVSSVYQTGRSLTTASGKTYITTQRPYRINPNKPFDFDLSRYTVADGKYVGGSVVIADGFSYRVKNVSAPEHGSVVKKSSDVYTYTPDGDAPSGKIKVTLEITKDDGGFEVDDVELVIEFVCSHELKKSVLERTVYTYSELPYSSATEAYEAGYAGYSTAVEQDNVNPTQNCNTDIWVPTPGSNAVMEVRGKLIAPSDGDYRIALRGRHSAALHVSTDGGKTYARSARRDHSTQNNTWDLDDPASYIDVTGLSAGDSIYFKETLLVDYNGAFIGLGWGKITDGTARIDYATAYRSGYKEDAPFVSDYLFKHNTTFGYDGSVKYGKGTLVDFSGYTAWQGYSQDMTELFDDDEANYIHSAKGADCDITPDQPFTMTVDLGETVTANTLIIHGEPTRKYLPKNFTLYAGTAVDNLAEIKRVENAAVTENDVVVEIPTTEMRYYKLVVTATAVDTNPTGSKYIAFRSVGVENRIFSGPGKLVAASSENMAFRGGWESVKAVSEFGRVLRGGKGDYFEFETDCPRFAVVSPQEFADITVYADGVKIADCSVPGQGVIFLSERLAPDSHSIKIVCGGTTDIDGIAFFKDE